MIRKIYPDIKNHDIKISPILSKNGSSNPKADRV